MKRLIFAIVAAVLLLPSCDKERPETEYVPTTAGGYILNNGNYTDNDSNIGFLDFEQDVVIDNVFEKVNGKCLGNLGQDLLIFGGKMYISVDGSGVIFVTDLDGKIIKEIVQKKNGETLSPRYLTSYGDAVYATYYQGYIGRIDTVGFNVKLVECGPNPDMAAVSQGKLYVATSGGLNYPEYCSTIDVFNANDLNGRVSIDVVTNPQYLSVDSKGDVYLISTGNYADIPSTLQRINPADNSVTVISEVSNPAVMTICNDKLYIVSVTYDETWNTVCDYVVYNTASGKVEGKVISDGTEINNGCSISVNPDNGDVYIGASDYVSNGDLYKFDKTGKLVKKYDTGGLNPLGIFFVKK